MVDTETWTRVQDRLEEKGGPHKVKRRARHTSLLAGLLHDELGVPFKSTHAVKDGKRYRYYVRATDEEHDGGRGWWVPAHDIESLVLDQLKAKLLDAHWISEALAAYAATPDELRAAFAAAEKHASALGDSTERTRQAPWPATPAGKADPSPFHPKTIRPDHLISLEDGKPYRTLKRHLARYGLTPDAYRTKWGLPADYPMTAAAYSEQRSKLALERGLGQKPGAKSAAANRHKAGSTKRPCGRSSAAR